MDNKQYSIPKCEYADIYDKQRKLGTYIHDKNNMHIPYDYLINHDFYDRKTEKEFIVRETVVKIRSKI